MTHPTDFRALILRMADELDHARQLYLDDRDAKCPLAAEARHAINRADLEEHLKDWDSKDRAALSAPQQGAPSDEELDALLPPSYSTEIVDLFGPEYHRAFARAVLARYGAQVAPVAVAERPWERDGWCDAVGNCWLHDGFAWQRLVVPKDWTKFRPFTHSLPHWALPLPEAQP